MMKEQDLIDLGFEREDEDSFYYYTLDLVERFSLISNASDEVKEGWYVEVFYVKIRFVEREQLENFINIVKRNII